MSDICSGDGLYITEGIWNGQRQTHFSKEYNWPISNEPTGSEWNTWRTVLKKSGICTNDTNRLLTTSLGVWRIWPKHWISFIDEEQRLVEKCKDGYAVYETQGRTRRKHYHWEGRLYTTLTQEVLCPTTVRLEGDKYIQEGSQAILANTINQEVSTNIKLSSKSTGDMKILKYYLKQGTAVAVSHLFQKDKIWN